MLFSCSRVLRAPTINYFVLVTFESRDVQFYRYVLYQNSIGFFFLGLELTCCVTAPAIPSFLSYIIGLIFYVTQFPECILLEDVRRRLDTIGIGKSFFPSLSLSLALFNKVTKKPFNPIHRFSCYLALLYRPRR